MATPDSWLSATQVNTGAAATGSQSSPQIIGLSNGNILVAYESSDAGTIGSGSNSDIIGRIYDAEGNVVVDHFQINSNRNADNERDFEIGASADGGFYMVYMDDDTNGTRTTVILERFNASGQSVDSLVIADEIDGSDLRNPQIAINNNFVGLPGSEGHRLYVTWEVSDGAGNIDVKGAYILENMAFAAGSPFDAAQNSSDEDRDHDSAMLTTGEVVVVNEELDGATVSLEVHVTGTNGIRSHQTFASLPNTAGSLANPRVASLVNGNFVVVWNENGDIRAQRFNNSAVALGGIIEVATGADNQNEAAIVALPDGGFVIAWDDDTDARFEAQAFFADGSIDGGQFIIGGAIDGTAPALGVTGDGRILFAGDQNAGGEEIYYSIWDPRDPGNIDSLDYASVPINFVNADVVTGGLGDSTINGDGGGDTLLGQGGNDVIDGEGGNDSIEAGAGNDSVFGGFGADTILGEAGEDQLFGGAGNDSIDGGSENDIIQGGDGDDTLIGGSGADTVDYSYSINAGGFFSGWLIDIDAGIAQFSSLGVVSSTDSLSLFEHVIGSGYGDVIVGNASANRLEGRDGNDTFIDPANANSDTFDGGLGTDTYDSQTMAWGDLAVFDMPAGGRRSSPAGVIQDTFISVERFVVGGGADFIGSAENESFTVTAFGTSHTNNLDGGGGNDTLDAGAGSDTVMGGDGDDLIIDRLEDSASTLNGGGGGADVLDLSDANEGFSMTDYVGNVVGGSGATLLISNFDIIHGTNFGDYFREIGDLDTVYGGGGNDSFEFDFNPGADFIYGGDGSDTLRHTGSPAITDLEAGTMNGTASFESVENFHALSNSVAVVLGSSVANDIRGNSGDDSLVGRAGDDTIRGEDGADTLIGNDDNDSLIGGNGNDSLSGGNGADYLIGGADADTLLGGDGDDTLSGGAGTDSLSGGANDDTLYGGAENDTLIGGNGNDYLSGGDGDDYLSGGNGHDTLIGGAGADTLQGYDGDDVIRIDAFDLTANLNGGNGRDRLQVENGRTFVTNGLSVYGFEEFRGADGNDSVRGNDAAINYDLGGGDGNDTLEGNAGADTLYGDNGNDVLVGGDGADYLSGGIDDDSLDGGSGNDTLLGSNGVDSLFGGAGADSLSGGNHNDSLYGGADSDTLIGGDGDDYLTGDDGDDSLSGGNGNDTLTGGAGSDTLQGFDGDDRITIDSFDLIANVNGGTGRDTLVIENGRTFVTNGLSVYGFEVFRGADGNDSVRGNDATVDYDLGGGDGNDTLEGNQGNDTLIGGSGDDVFVFDDNFGNDVITFFSSSNAEKIDLSQVTAITDFADLVTNHLANNGGLAQIFVGADTILLQNVAFGDVGTGLAYDANDFLF